MNQLLRPSEIERPLGQNLKGSSRPPRQRRFDARSLATGLAALCLVTTAGAIALRDRPFRIPAEVVVTTPEIAPSATSDTKASAQTAKADSENDAPASTGPSIIKINPDDGDAAASKNVIVIRDPSAIGQNLRVAHLPDRDLIEQSDTDPLPIRAADGRRPFDG